MEVCSRGVTNYPNWTSLRLMAVQAASNEKVVTFEFVGDNPPPPPPAGVVTPVEGKVFAGTTMLVPTTVQQVVILSQSNQITIDVQVEPGFEIAEAAESNIPPPWPSPTVPHLPLIPAAPPLRDGMGLWAPPPGYGEKLGRGSFQAIRLGNTIRIRAVGTLANGNELADLRINSRSWPPRFATWTYSPEITLPYLRNFDFSLDFTFPPEPETVTIVDASGAHDVQIQTPLLPATTLLAKGLPSPEIGFGSSLEAAIDSAIAAFPENFDPDRLWRYHVLEQGKLVGGFAGMNVYFASVTRADATKS